MKRLLAGILGALAIVIGSLAHAQDAPVYRGDGGITWKEAQGVFIMGGNAPWSYAAAASGIVNTTTAVTVKAAGAAGLKNYVTGLCLSHAALGGATEFAIRDGAGGTVLFRMQLQTGAMGMECARFDPPLRGTAATLLEIVTLTGVTGGVYANLTGFTAP